ncbi:hypothetical protein Bca4012_026774 [Brassica carinata]
MVMCRMSTTTAGIVSRFNHGVSVFMCRSAMFLLQNHRRASGKIDLQATMFFFLAASHSESDSSRCHFDSICGMFQFLPPRNDSSSPCPPGLSDVPFKLESNNG